MCGVSVYVKELHSNHLWQPMMLIITKKYSKQLFMESGKICPGDYLVSALCLTLLFEFYDDVHYSFDLKNEHSN